MKFLRFMACLAVLGGALLALPRAASASVFCPASITAVANLAALGRQNTYGIALALEPGDVHAVRLRVDSETTRYAVDITDIDLIGGAPLTQRRYFTLPLGERLTAAWVESTGAGPQLRLPCPIASPYDITEPPPVDQRIAAQREAESRAVRDAFSSRTPVLTPTAFGAVEKLACPQPFASARALNPAPPVYPPEARGIRAVGTAVVRVELDDQSTVLNAALVRSTGYAPLDRAARDAALRSTYKTETFACRPIASVYDVTVVFNAP